jgi:hypothetical protein
MAARNFPGPYVSDTKEDDPLMKRRPPDHMEIGARPATLKATGDKSNLMNLKHVGDQNPK